ncbi:hypothetical protein [Marmoricola endophyticus]|uniref:hypothetical protein n=1 Tax=Marmoricola endophyticus TaxID=2040280 RepID=UPI00166ACD30|nr:hypothetical protein [Marmoricola endophyticus]
MSGRGAGAALAVCLLLGGAVAGCGDPGEAYCDQLRSDQAALGEIVNATTPGALLTGLPTLRQVGAKAPEDLTDEWQTFLNAVEGLDDAVHAAGLRPGEVRGSLPTTLSADDRAAITGAADVLASSAVTEAADGIETQARDVCKVNIGL